MATQKFEFMVHFNKPGVPCIYPVMEASNQGMALTILKAQYPQAHLITFRKIVP